MARLETGAEPNLPTEIPRTLHRTAMSLLTIALTQRDLCELDIASTSAGQAGENIATIGTDIHFQGTHGVTPREPNPFNAN